MNATAEYTPPVNLQAASIARHFCATMRETYRECDLAAYQCPRCLSDLVTVRPVNGEPILRGGNCVGCGAPNFKRVHPCGRVEILAV